MPQQIMMGPPTQPQLSEAKIRLVREYADRVYKALSGLPIGDINYVFMEVNRLVAEKKV